MKRVELLTARTEQGEKKPSAAQIKNTATREKQLLERAVEDLEFDAKTLGEAFEERMSLDYFSIDAMAEAVREIENTTNKARILKTLLEKYYQ